MSLPLEAQHFFWSEQTESMRGALVVLNVLLSVRSVLLRYREVWKHKIHVFRRPDGRPQAQAAVPIAVQGLLGVSSRQGHRRPASANALTAAGGGPNDRSNCARIQLQDATRWSKAVRPPAQPLECAAPFRIFTCAIAWQLR